MDRIGSRTAIIAAVLLLTPTPVLATDAPETGRPREPGSLAGPSMVGMPAADSASGLPIDWMEFIAVGDQAYFVAEGQQPGELWRTDGTAEGTVLATDRFATEREDPITQMTAVGDELYFAAEDRHTGVELWRTDGTDEGTQLVADLVPGDGSSYPEFITPIADSVLFWAKGPRGSCGLWRTDGTSEGTAMIRAAHDFGLRPPDSKYCVYPDTAVRVGDEAVLSTGRGRHRIWRSDGTVEGTTLLRVFPGRSSREWVVADDAVAYFAADDGKHGRELWRTDGTVEGTELVADVASGRANADPEPVAAVDDGIFFIADAPTGGRALWHSDGTAGGTSVVNKLELGWLPSFAAGDELLYFWGDDGRHGSELWRSDGTREGTRMVRDIAKGRKSADGSGYGGFATAGGLAFFAARDGQHGSELWVSDGTHDGTRMLADIERGRDGTGPSWITRFGDTVLFSADDRVHGRELWRSDGTLEGTFLVRDIGARMASVTVLDATAVGDDLAFLGDRGGRGAPLHWIDGATGHERRLVMVPTGEISHAIEALGDQVVFTGRSARTGVEPWISDGTGAGTRMLKDVARGRAPNVCASRAGCGTHAADSGPGPFVVVGDTAYFSAYDQKHGRELWRSDGTRKGTRLLKDILPGRKSSIDRRAFSAVDGELYFAADDGRHGSELWRSDGTRAGTRMITDIGPGSSVQRWDAPVAAGGHVYFGARSTDVGRELWRTDGTAEGTVLVRDIRPGPKASKPEDLIAVGDRLYFTAIDGEHGRELWRTDGTAAGTVLVKDIVPGKRGSLLGEFAALGDRLYFAVWDGPGELVIPGVQYRSDGTEEGTQPFGPAQDGADGMRRFWTEFPATVALGDRLFFPADDGIHGTELWSTDGTLEGTGLVSDLRPGPKGSDPQRLVAAGQYLYFTAADGEHGRQFWQLPVSDA